MITGTSFSEYYFEYHLEQVGVDGSVGVQGIQEPCLYFERDYRKKNLPYSLTFVPKEWLETQHIYKNITSDSKVERVKELLRELPYDSVRIVYNVGAVDYKPLLDPSSRAYKTATNNRVVPYKEFYQNGGVIVIDDTAEERSGVGVIEMLKEGRGIARFVFVVNCIRRKKISYTISKASREGLLSLSFQCKSMPKGLSVVLVHHPKRLPCLKEDIARNSLGEISLDFDKPDISKHIQVNNELVQNQHVFSLTFANEDFNKYYFLDCKKNDTSKMPKNHPALFEMDDRSCPYCHTNIVPGVMRSERYKKGGIVCRRFNERGNPTVSLPVILTPRKSMVKNCLYCAGDLIPYNTEEHNIEDAGRFNGEFLRLLPYNFLEHQAFKIAFAGSARAGKTTYISRFFGITGDDRQISMPMTMTANALSTFGLSVKTAMTEQLAAINTGTQEKEYQAIERNWAENNEQYIERRLTLEPHYPGATTTGDYTKYPFIAEVNNKAYVSFYDIAGEDAEHSMQVRSIANEKPIGVFCIVNGEPDTTGNSKVVSMLVDANLHKDSPIAVIVTKMDSFEKAFDKNCHCLNTDYFNKIQGYDKSELEREIDLSSEEIKAYLTQNGLLPDLDKAYTNIKFFGVSSFNFGDSIHKQGENLNSVGSVYFECSSKHLELPFVWMMKQFGLIK